MGESVPLSRSRLFAFYFCRRRRRLFFSSVGHRCHLHVSGFLSHLQRQRLVWALLPVRGHVSPQLYQAGRGILFLFIYF